MPQIDTKPRKRKLGSMPDIKPTLMEKILLIRHRQGWRSADVAGLKFGIAGNTLLAYESGRRNPSKFARLHLERCVEAYESAGLAGLEKVVKEAGK